MASIILYDDSPGQADALGLALSKGGHEVEVFSDLDRARSRLGGPKAQVVVIGVGMADGGPGLLVGQCRAAWPDAQVVAVVARGVAGSSKISEMGLWAPDLTLSRPVSPARLVDAVATLLSGPADARPANRNESTNSD